MFVEHKEAVEITEAPAKVLKLSEAIRIGARKTPQCAGHYLKGGATCAWGAAAVGFGVDLRDRDFYDKANKLHRESAHANGICCEVMTRNDRGASREEIADWLAVQGL